MKQKITAFILCLILIASALPVSARNLGQTERSAPVGGTVLAADAEAPGAQAGGEKLGFGVEYVRATFRDETCDVRKEVMEIDGGMAAPIHFEVDYTRYVNMTFGLSQRNGKEKKQLIQNVGDRFQVNADEFEVGWPVYLDAYSGDDGSFLASYELGLRINKGFMAERVPDTLSAEFQAGLKVDMSDLLPGMQLNVLPFLIPVTIKTYTDGAVRVGLGLNASDLDFWMKAGNGEMPEAELGNNLREIFKGDPHNLDDISGKNMGVIFLFSGWAEGNMNSIEPIKGHMELFIGTGFDIQGQYGIFTWEITLTGGGQAMFDFSFNFDPLDSQYHFKADEIRLGVKGGIELYGGIGCTLASIGVYGAGSIAYQERLYPNSDIEHLILAGELGLKAKLFGKVIACYKIIAGEKDFVNDKKKKDVSLELAEEEMHKLLLSNNYANQPAVLLKAGGNFTWHGEFVEQRVVSNGYEKNPNFAHLLATDVFPDSPVQIVSSGSKALPEMTLVFTGSDERRAEGNRSILLSSYYDIGPGFVCEPKPVNDDGTADFNPYLYSNPDSFAYLVWENATAPVPAAATLSEISNLTDIWFGSCVTGSNWTANTRITNYAGTGTYATGARVTADSNNIPAIAYYTNAINDPAGLEGKHEVYLATTNGSGAWTSEKLCEVNGTMDEIGVGFFDTMPAVSVSWKENGVRKTALYRGGKMIWSRDNASSGKFLGAGYQSAYFTWFENGRIKKLSPNLAESYLTPSTINIPDDNYEIFGRAGGSTVMVASTTVKDAQGSAFAYVSRDGGTNWFKADLSILNEYAYVSSLSAAYTYENEPVVVYTLQNYKANVALDGSQTTDGERFLLGQDDDRFTDTRADLYIAARSANAHVVIEEAEAIDVEKNVPGKPAKIRVRIRNTGLYDVESGIITCGGSIVGVITQKIKPWETADVEVQVLIPSNAGGKIQEYTLEASTRDVQTPDSRFTVAVHPGYLSADMKHTFQFGKEGISYRLYNKGYTEKTARIMARDEARDVTLYERTVKVAGGDYFDGKYEASNSVFSLDGCQNVTLYVLLDGESYDSPDISANRWKSVKPLSELYAQPISNEVESETTLPDNGTEEGGDGSGSRKWLPFVIAGASLLLLLACAVIVSKALKKKAADKEAKEETEEKEKEAAEEKAEEKPEEEAEKKTEE